ncbi:hypothetical protein GCM10009826_29270 [Humibacillus xanthopallidus]
MEQAGAVLAGASSSRGRPAEIRFHLLPPRAGNNPCVTRMSAPWVHAGVVADGPVNAFAGVSIDLPSRGLMGSRPCLQTRSVVVGARRSRPRRHVWEHLAAFVGYSVAVLRCSTPGPSLVGWDYGAGVGVDDSGGSPGGSTCEEHGS